MPVSKRLTQLAFLKIVAKVGLTLWVLGFVFRGIDVAHLLDMLEHQNHELVLETVLFMVVQSVLGGIRWRMITDALATGREHCISLYQSQRIYYIGVFFTTCLPGTVGGDMVRIWMTRDLGIPLGQAVNSVIIDRMIALLGIGIMVLITLPVIAGLVGVNMQLVYALAAVATVAGLALLWNIERVLKPFAHKKSVHWLLHFVHSLKLILRHPVVGGSSICLAVTAHISYAMSAYAMAKSLGISMSIMQSMTFMPLIMLLTTIPISFGGWGVREAAMVGLLGLIGVRAESALMLSIQLGLLGMVITLPASVMWLMGKKRARHA